MKAGIIAIGDEILIGQVLDTNTHWLNEQLNDLGIETTINIAIGDTPQEIKESIDFVFKTCDIILLTGGLGPTKDDKTKEVLAQYFDTELVFDPVLFERIKGLFERLNIPMSNNIHDQCHLPKSAQKLTNNKGTAPGMLLTKGDKTLYSMPGVPYEMKDIFTNGIIPIYKGKNDNQTYHWTLKTAGVSESIISENLESFEANLPSSVSMAYLPSTHSVRLRLSIKANKKEATALYEKLEKELYVILGNAIYTKEDITLSQAVGKLLSDKNMKMATAESCTGGYLAHLITAMSGSSQYFEGSIISYSNDMKHNLLNVPLGILESHGAVSQQTVEAMLKGLLQNLDAQVGISISGIAGPNGGTEEKPVGTIWIAWGDKDNIQTHCLQYAKDRTLNIHYASAFALNKLRLFLLGK